MHAAILMQNPITFKKLQIKTKHERIYKTEFVIGLDWKAGAKGKEEKLMPNPLFSQN